MSAAGTAAILAALAADPAQARLALSQNWPPFVLVAGLLLVGFVAEQDRLFSAAGNLLARLAADGFLLFFGSTLLIALVTAVLNLDTSVAFLTPILVYAARERGEGEAPLLYGCLLLSNAASLLLPGSNLTNLIVLGRLRLSGGQFLSRMAPVWLVSVLVTALVIALLERDALRANARTVRAAKAPALGLGVGSVLAVTVLVVGFPTPAIPVVAVGLLACGTRLLNGRATRTEVFEVLGLPVLIALFGMAVGLGTLGRVWSGPAVLLSHLGAWSTAGLAAASSVLVNNLPAASLLAARAPARPYALLIGLNIGPNLLITGSLSWILWLRSARLVKARPSIARATALGWLSAPLAMAAALAVLGATGRS